MHRELQKEFDLLMLDIPGQGLSDSIEEQKAYWNQVAELVHQALVGQIDILQPAATYGVGHSLGGVLTLLSAHQHPDTFRSLVLLDPVLFTRRMIVLMNVARFLRLTNLVHPLVRPTLNRRQRWDSADSARDYLRRRKVYLGWTDSALQAYVDYALRADDAGAVELRCHPAIEAGFFATIPAGLWKALREVSCATTCVMGEDTFPFALEAAKSAELTSAKITTKLVPGGHCHMQQNPLNAAKCIKAAIDGE